MVREGKGRGYFALRWGVLGKGCSVLASQLEEGGGFRLLVVVLQGVASLPLPRSLSLSLLREGNIREGGKE